MRSSCSLREVEALGRELRTREPHLYESDIAEG